MTAIILQKKLAVTGDQKPKALGMDDEGLHDLSCTGCKKLKREKAGEYHCKYCGVLCEPCSSKHPKIPKKRSHWAVKIRLLAEEKVFRKPTFNYVSRCEIHTTKLILGYCLNCGELVCNTCLKEEHKDCKIIETVEKMSADVKRERDHQNARSELFDILQRNKNSTKMKNKEMQKLNQKSENFDKALHQTQLKLMEMILSILERYRKEKDKFYQQEVNSIQSDINKCNNVASVIENAVDKLDEAFHTGKEVDLWIAMKKLAKIITECEGTVNDAETDSVTEAHMEFYPNKDLEDFFKNPESIGELKLTPSKSVELKKIENEEYKGQPKQTNTLGQTRRTSTPGQTERIKTPTGSTNSSISGNRRKKHSIVSSQQSVNEINDEGQLVASEKNTGNISLKFIGKKEVLFDFDTTDCCVTGCTFLPNGRLVLADYNNSRLKLFNPEYELLSHKWFDDRPWDITNLQTEVIAVSFPFIKTIKIIKASRDFVVQDEIRTEFKCHGLGYHKTDKTLWLACGEGTKTQLQVYSLDGMVKKIVIPKHGILKEPSYVSMSADSTKFYVSDLKNGIVAFSTVKDCEVLFQYRDENIQKYWGIESDPAGRVYVVTTEPDCLYVLLGQFNGRLLAELDSDEKPCAVAYNAALGTLVVSRWKAEDIEVYIVVPDKSET